jgi:copper chaperone
MKSEKFKVDGMTCNHCVNAIQNALKEIGVKGVVDLKNKTVEVNYDESKTNIVNIKKIIVENGYVV